MGENMAKKIKDMRKNLKIDATLNDELRFLCDFTGKTRIELLHELLDAMLLVSSNYSRFMYFVEVHGVEGIEIKFYGEPKLISGSMKVMSPSQVTEIENDMIEQAEKQLKISKGTGFNHIAKELSREVKNN